MLYICLCGYEPFYGVNEEELIAANKTGEFEFHLPEWGHVSEGAKDLVSFFYRSLLSIFSVMEQYSLPSFYPEQQHFCVELYFFIHACKNVYKYVHVRTYVRTLW